MGLSEKTRYVLAHDLKSLLEGGERISMDRLGALTLALDQYRRELGLSIARHTNEEAYVAKQVAQCEAAVALWQARLELARSRERAELVPPAKARLEKEKARRAEFRENHLWLTRAIANLRVNYEKVERTLQLVRRKKRRMLEADRQSVGEETVESLRAAASLADELARAGAGAPADPLEDAFRALELEEVAGRFDREDGGEDESESESESEGEGEGEGEGGGGG